MKIKVQYLPSFFPKGSSYLTPTHQPGLKFVCPKKEKWELQSLAIADEWNLNHSLTTSKSEHVEWAWHCSSPFIATLIHIKFVYCIRCWALIKTIEPEKRLFCNNPVLNIHPLTPKISLAILLTVCTIILVMLIWRIWYWIN